MEIGQRLGSLLTLSRLKIIQMYVKFVIVNQHSIEYL